MPMDEQALSVRDAGRNIGLELLESVRQVKAGKVGKVTKVRIPLALEARQQLRLSQARFAEAIHVSKRTLQAWEQNRRQPSGAAMALLQVAIAKPDAVREALAHT